MPGRMSPAHIKGFIDDLTKIDAGFIEESSCVQGLLKYLRATAHVPVRLANAKQAMTLCTDPAAPQLAKFEPAIARLVQVWGTDLPYPGHEVKIGRLMFRGDSRAPDEIFTFGFTKASRRAIYQRDTHDIDPASAVAMTPNPHVAAQFPLPRAFGPEAFAAASQDPCWVYALYLERGYNTMMHQGLDYVSGAAAAKNVLYANELATIEVPANYVFGAIRVKRQFQFPAPPPVPKPNDWFTYGIYSFVPHSWTGNPTYNGPYAEEYVTMLAKVFDSVVRPLPKAT